MRKKSLTNVRVPCILVARAKSTEEFTYEKNLSTKQETQT